MPEVFPYVFCPDAVVGGADAVLGDEDGQPVMAELFDHLVHALGVDLPSHVCDRPGFRMMFKGAYLPERVFAQRPGVVDELPEIIVEAYEVDGPGCGKLLRGQPRYQYAALQGRVYETVVVQSCPEEGSKAVEKGRAVAGVKSGNGLGDPDFRGPGGGVFGMEARCPYSRAGKQLY